MIKNLLILLLTLLSFNITSANVLIKGKLVDSNSNEPIPFANIYIKNTTIGVISNEEGKFQINIPENYASKILIFSAMGFQTQEFIITKWKSNSIKTITLQPSITTLDEIVVSSNRLTANQIVQKAFANYYKKFSTQPFIAKGFLRYTEKTKKEYKWLVEAAVEMYDPGIDKLIDKIKFNIVEVRKSFDNRVLDTTDIYRLYLTQAKGVSYRKAWRNNKDISNLNQSEIQDAINYFDNRSGNPKTLFTSRANNIRYYNQKDAIFDKKIVKKHTFKLDTIISYDNNDVYKIKITPTIPSSRLIKVHGKSLLPFGWIYIRMKDFAILELEYTLLHAKTKDHLYERLKGSRLFSNLKIKFVEINNKMYPKYISLKGAKNTNRMFTAITNSKNVVTNDDDYYFLQKEIIFTEIITDKEIIKLRLQQPWDDNLFTPRPYNAKFWEHYNVLLESKEQQKMRQDLEKRIKLKEQFKQNN